MKASWTRNGEGWAVLVEANDGSAAGLSGQRVEVRRRDGATRSVALGALIEGSGSRAKYTVVRTPRGDDRQPDAERTGTAYTVAIRVTNAKGEWVEWAMPIDSTDPLLAKEASPEVARCAVHAHDLITNGVINTSRKAAPKRRSAPKKPTTKRKAVA